MLSHGVEETLICREQMCNLIIREKLACMWRTQMQSHCDMCGLMSLEGFSHEWRICMKSCDMGETLLCVKRTLP